MATVLVIDDEPMIGEIASRILKRAGHNVIVASGSDEALAAAAGEEAHFDLVIVDERMPGLSAMETIRQLRERQPSLPMILSSGYRIDLPDYQKEFGSLFKSLPKPYSSEELLQFVSDLLKEDSGGGSGGGTTMSLLFFAGQALYLPPHDPEIMFA